MTEKARKIVGWILAGLISAFLIVASGLPKLGLFGDMSEHFAKYGISNNTAFVIGIIEITSALLFLIPRTGVIGTLLLASYLGGAIATHLEHNESLSFAVTFEALIWITAFIRFPELSRRILGKA